MASERCAERLKCRDADNVDIDSQSRFACEFTSELLYQLGTMGSPFTARKLSFQDKPPAGWQAYAGEDVSRADAYTAARTPAGVLDWKLNEVGIVKCQRREVVTRNLARLLI